MQELVTFYFIRIKVLFELVSETGCEMKAELHSFILNSDSAYFLSCFG